MAQGNGGGNAVGASHGSNKSMSGSRVETGQKGKSGGAGSVRATANRVAAAKSNGSRANIVSIPTGRRGRR